MTVPTDMIKFGQRKNDTDRIRREAVVFLKQSFPLPAQAPAPRSRIYRALYDAQDFCSRQTLAKECGLSLPTVHQYLTELFQAGLVRYSGEERATGGRKAQGIEISKVTDIVNEIFFITAVLSSSTKASVRDGIRAEAMAEENATGRRIRSR